MPEESSGVKTRIFSEREREHKSAAIKTTPSYMNTHSRRKEQEIRDDGGRKVMREQGQKH